MQVVEQYASPFYKNIIDLPPSMVRKLWKKNQVIILDVRTPEEYEDHHIPGALLVPLDYLEILAKYIPQHKDVAVFCEHGNRARYATYGMPHIYKRRAYYVIGGMALWMAMGYEVERGMDENGIKWQEWLEKEFNQ
ncbi:rhodanese [Sulfolobus sp. A20]|uniref:rhodanese-like domain-containing protein n=1 Tax=Sulfolobaceae TaxID=118883 RepID=UPI000845C5D5|nr:MULTISPECIES: rhodanese-like domain-containing protein [unclassified Sulfolobus]TRM73966.1 rhodanese-like domain-containing protein [Sulfolobus sp. A20-N-F8]TRM74357.1 rhodanese-like domain-containing protein [Sulfolobus sp. E5]TRM79445.1 rhodanese-like domain-containing protein [Sulfolobus sp. B5]TRM83483.1 rhodanese-like domain-containing protein [Sulfolobus sp. A20-N-F6]TRM89319.1 rhodanese-like domain-containing protein [Sulfolobus sp. E3]TRM95205.1 rhodanese-like domain-containing pro